MNFMKTPIQELIEKFEDIQANKCKTLQERIFFDGVLAIIESTFLDKEKKTMIDFAAEVGTSTMFEPNDNDKEFYRIIAENQYKANYDNIRINEKERTKKD